MMQGVAVAAAYKKLKQNSGSLEDLASLVVALTGLPEFPDGCTSSETMIGAAGLLAVRLINENYVKNVLAFKTILTDSGLGDEAYKFGMC